ncbi:MAG: histidine--tRNA ligase [Flavobacteriaceae bacterium]|nr:histidine--tRNA ligase [Flavobacteriaceae bacterium]
MSKKPSIPKGTRDFSPQEVAKRDYIIDCIKKHFTIFGFAPIETPSFENLNTLMGKYGEEGDRLIFKILNSGDFISKVDDVTYSSKNSKTLLPKLTEKALRYDLTVPFARYVVMHQNDIQFPFKRYQIQPVWRADRPQKGRFREFYQCDADVVGPSSKWQELELLQLYDRIFSALGFKDLTVRINHRKILSGIAETIGAKHHLVDFTVALDKLDKVGTAGVIKEMESKGISKSAIDKAEPLFALQGASAEKIRILDNFLEDFKEGIEGVVEIADIIDAVSEMDLRCISLELDVTLARGLNYYTGCILEVNPPEGVELGSIGGGGRYDDLTGIFGLNGVSGVGISFGLERIYMVMEELNLFPESIDHSVDVLFANFGEEEAKQAFGICAQLRDLGISADMYPVDAKMQKQMKYANNRNIPYVVLVGANELASDTFVVKNMEGGGQATYKTSALQDFADQIKAAS